MFKSQHVNYKIRMLGKTGEKSKNTESALIFLASSASSGVKLLATSGRLTSEDGGYKDNKKNRLCKAQLLFMFPLSQGEF